MATCTWSGATNNNWSNAGNWDAKPGNGDDVVMANAVNCVVDEATANLKSFDMTGYTGTLSGSSAINVIGAASSTVSVKFAGTITWTGTLNLNPTAADTNIQLTSNGKTIANVTVNGNSAGDVFFIDGLTCSGTVTLTQGILHTDGASDNSGLTHSWGKFASSNSNTRTLTLGTNSITLTGTGTDVWNVWTYTNFTLSTNTATLTFTGDSPQMYPGTSVPYNSVVFTGAGTPKIDSVNLYCVNFTRTGTAVKTSALWLNCDINCTGAVTLTGNSSVNRLLVYGASLGSYKTIILGASATCATNSSNVDFRDITMSGGAANERDCSAVTGGSGDCGGNTGITFTTADDWYWHQGTGNWSDTTKWFTATNGGGSSASSLSIAPLPQDTCYFDANSFDGNSSITTDMPRLSNINSSAATQTNFIQGSATLEFYGNVDFSGFATGDIYQTISFMGSRGGSHTLNFRPTHKGNTVNFYQIGSTYTLTGNFTTTGSGTTTLYNGILDADTYNFSCFVFNASNSNTRSLIMGSGTWTMSGDESYNRTIWTTETTTNLTFNAETSTIQIGSSGGGGSGDAGQKKGYFKGGGLTFNNLNIVGGVGAGGIYGVIWLTGNNAFSTFTINAPKNIALTAGTTTTVNSLVATGDASNLIHIDSTTSSSASIVDTAGTNTVHYCHIGETGAVNASGGATFDATDNCEVNSSTGWTTASSPSIDQVGASLALTSGTQSVSSISIVSLDQLAASLTLSPGTQSLEVLEVVTITQVAASLVLNVGTQSVSAGEIISVAVNQSGISIILSSGTQSIGSQQVVTLAPTTLVLTLSVGLPTLGTIRIVSLSPEYLGLVLSSGVQVVQAQTSATVYRYLGRVWVYKTQTYFLIRNSRTLVIQELKPVVLEKGLTLLSSGRSVNYMTSPNYLCFGNGNSLHLGATV